MKTNLEIVFFHEIGHYIAHQLVFKHFGIGEIDKIVLIEKRADGFINYEGQTIPKIPHGKSKSTPLINLPENIAELVYGCYFQSIFLNQKFEVCFDYKNKSAKGYKDYHDVISGLILFKIDGEKRKILYPYLKIEYFNSFKKNKNDFEFLFKFNPLDFLKETEDGFEVELGKLNNSLIGFIEKHSSYFIEFVEKIRKILK